MLGNRVVCTQLFFQCLERTVRVYSVDFQGLEKENTERRRCNEGRSWLLFSHGSLSCLGELWKTCAVLNNMEMFHEEVTWGCRVGAGGAGVDDQFKRCAMKKVLCLLAGCLMAGAAFSQDWVQMGSDVDGEAADDGSGVSVSLSADGSRVAIGARRNTGSM